jgi:AmmeMemoRadiSam system radical SAM enzyme
VADACRERGIKAVAVTAGYMCAEPRREFYRHIDAVNVDLKAFAGDFYRRMCLARLEPVQETLLYLTHQTEVWVEITTLPIPGLNDSDQEIEARSKSVAGQLGPDVPVRFTAFHPDFKLRDRPPTPSETLNRAGGRRARWHVCASYVRTLWQALTSLAFATCEPGPALRFGAATTQAAFSVLRLTIAGGDDCGYRGGR